MLIVRNSWCLATLVAALALAGCGSAGGGGGGGDCEFDTLKKGCVEILNFRSTTQTFGGVSIPPGHANASGHTEPGTNTVMVTDTSLNSTHDFQGTINGQAVNVTCTVTNLGWIDVNPRLVIQQEAFGAEVDCQNW